MQSERSPFSECANQPSPQPSPIGEGAICHPELGSGSQEMLKQGGQSDVQHEINYEKRTYRPSVLTSYCQKKAAFTLAEVLITLGIIGVVAAMTIPNLIANYREKVFVTSAKRGYSVLTNAMNKWNADNGVVGDPTYFWLSGTNDELLNELAKVLNVNKICLKGSLASCGGKYDILQYKKVNDGQGNTTQENWISGNYGRIILADGSFVTLERTSGDSCDKLLFGYSKDENGNYIEDPSSPTGFAGYYYESHLCGRLAYDTNGLKGPNQIGVDVFQIPYSSDGTIGTNNNLWGNIDYVLAHDKLIKTEKYTPGKFSQ